MVPDWLKPDITTIQGEADIQASQMFATVDPDQSDEERIAALINGHIETQGTFVLSELRRAATPRPFPSTVAVLETAWPWDGAEDDADGKAAYDDDNLQRIESQKSGAALIVKELVIAKLYYSMNGEEAKTKATNRWIAAQSLLSSARKDLKKIKCAYEINTLPPLV